MNIDAVVARACERVPGLLQGALVLLPDGYLIGAAGPGRSSDLEPLTRSAVRCLSPRSSPAFTDDEPAGASPCVEYLFVIEEQLVAVQRGRRDQRLALAVVTSADHNLAFVLGATRLALAEIEGVIDLAGWGL